MDGVYFGKSKSEKRIKFLTIDQIIKLSNRPNIMCFGQLGKGKMSNVKKKNPAISALKQKGSL